MKRIISFLFTAVISVYAFAAGPLQFTDKGHDFGTIHADNGPVSYDFEFTNSSAGEAAAILTVATGGCECTKATYQKKPVAPGAKSAVRVIFDPRGRKGEFSREIKVKYMCGKKTTTVKLPIYGVIIP